MAQPLYTIRGRIQENWAVALLAAVSHHLSTIRRGPTAAVRGIRHMLARGGVFSMIDIDAFSNHAYNPGHPIGPFLYTVRLMHCLLSISWPEPGYTHPEDPLERVFPNKRSVSERPASRGRLERKSLTVSLR